MAKDSIRGGTLTAKTNGSKLARLRQARKLKQRDVEEELGIPRGQLTRFETGKLVGIKYILKLASFYGEKPKDLLDSEGITSTSDLLTDLAKLHGARLDFSENGNNSENGAEELNDNGQKHRVSTDVEQTFSTDPV